MGKASGRKRVRREQRARRALERERAAAAGAARGCLVCRLPNGGFTSREHPFPESLGNTEIVIGAGVVCDRCNNTVLSTLDQALCEFFPIMVRRTMLGITSKQGKVPTTRLVNGTFEHLGPASLAFQPHGNQEMVTETHRDEYGIHLHADMQGGRRLTTGYAAQLSRALLKVALELAWLDHGERMLEPSYDHLRGAVLGEPFDGFVALGKEGDPDQAGVTLHYAFQDVPAGPGLWVVGDFFGVTMLTHSRLDAPVDAVPSQSDVIRFGPNAPTVEEQRTRVVQ